jgi:dCTP deaminase
MTFWSGETLAAKLPTLITPFNPKRIDCAAYQLGIGDQAFVTSDKLSENSPEPNLVTVLTDAPKNMLRIPPGQFAFLLTHEKVVVPDDATAFISMRARYKFKGLINVSGFTVDPGWSGKLLFSVYNAGPGPVLLEKEEAAFLIVYASLDQKTKLVYDGDSKDQVSIRTSVLSGLNSQVFSPHVLKSQLDDVHKRLGTMVTFMAITTSVAGALAVITALVIAAVQLLPSWVGVVVARTLDAANYEIHQKADPAQSTASAAASSSSAAKGVVLPASAASAARKKP